MSATSKSSFPPRAPHRVARRRAENALAEGFKHDRPLASCDDHTANADHLLVALRLADDGKGVLPDLVGGRDVIGRIEIPLVDLVARHESMSIVCVLSTWIAFSSSSSTKRN